MNGRKLATAQTSISRCLDKATGVGLCNRYDSAIRGMNRECAQTTRLDLKVITPARQEQPGKYPGNLEPSSSDGGRPVVAREGVRWGVGGRGPRGTGNFCKDELCTVLNVVMASQAHADAKT